MPARKPLWGIGCLMFLGVLVAVWLKVVPNRGAAISHEDASLPKAGGTASADSGDKSEKTGSLIFSDFRQTEPAGAVTTEATYGKWYYRTDAKFMAQGDDVLHVLGGGGVADLVYRPSLVGRYDLYAGVRGVSLPTGIQLKTDSMEQFATIAVPAQTSHKNLEVLWAHDVEMRGQSLILHAYGRPIYLDYLKFILVDQDIPRSRPLSDLVRYESRRSAEGEIAAWLKSGQLVQREFRDPREPPAFSSDEMGQGFVAFAVPWMALTFPSTVPSATTQPLRLDVRVAKGEVEPVAFAIHALRDIDALEVAVDAPTFGASGDRTNAKIELSEVASVRKRTTAILGAGEYMDLPCVLGAAAVHPVAKGKTCVFWATVDVPEGMSAGTYQREIRVFDAGRLVESIPLAIEVYPFALEAPTGLNIGWYYRGTRGLSEPERAFPDMKRHGMTSVAWYGTSKLRITGDWLAPKVEFQGSELARILDLFVKTGFTGDFTWCLSDDEVQQFCAKFLPDEARFAQAYSSIVRQIDEECRRRKWPRILFEPYDEVTSNPSLFPSLARELRAVKRGGGITQADHIWLKSPVAAIQSQIDACVPNIDIFTLRYSGKPVFYVDQWPEILEQARSRGKKVYTYNINNGLAIPEMETMRFSAGWFFRTLGIGCDGYYLWAYQNVSSDAWVDFDGPTDCVQQYPATDQHPGGPALYWEALREGVDDLRYILTLEKALAVAQADPRRGKLVEEGRNLLAGLAASIDTARIRRECVFLESHWDRTYTLPDGRRIAEGQFHLPSGWTFARYDQARHEIAELIVRLRQTTGNGVMGPNSP
ncbi:MAG TPA: hypothetical protein VG838_07000 [Opitutaceae bacterium]|nr:hypothetical protein [Lacunisphaera sp.]HWA09178.1 hypothetical protein [Opitutaceae bacterium]